MENELNFFEGLSVTRLLEPRPTACIGDCVFVQFMLILRYM